MDHTKYQGMRVSKYVRQWQYISLIVRVVHTAASTDRLLCITPSYQSGEQLHTEQRLTPNMSVGGLLTLLRHRLLAWSHYPPISREVPLIMSLRYGFVLSRLT